MLARQGRLGTDWPLGLICLLIGLFVIVVAQNYAFGSASRMGPGFFPTMVGILLALNGLLVMFLRSAQDEEGQGAALDPATALRAIGGIVGSFVFFGLTLPRYGLLVAVAGLVLISSVVARPDAKWPESIVLSVALCLFAVVIFVLLLELPLKVLPL